MESRIPALNALSAVDCHTKIALKRSLRLALSTSASQPILPISANGTKDDATRSSPDTNNSTPQSTPPKADNVFLDNLGTIFLSAIGLLICYLVRSYYNTQNRTNTRYTLEEIAALDPIELDDLRTANSEFTVEVFKSIMDHLYSRNNSKKTQIATSNISNSNSLTYPEFMNEVRHVMVQMKGEEFTIELGHLLDRVVLAALQRQLAEQKQQQLKYLHIPEPAPLTTLFKIEMPIDFWLTTLSLAVHGSVGDRIALLYQILQRHYETEQPTREQVVRLVGYMQETCQLVTDAQIVPHPTNHYPTIQYQRATPLEMVQQHWTKTTEKDINSTMQYTTVDIKDWKSLLCSKSVCAWGECYRKRKQL